MTCEGWQEFILDKGYLDDVQQRVLSQHLSNCIECRAWAKVLAETEAMAAEQLHSEVNPLALRALVLRAVARERRQTWMAAVPDLLDVVGWATVGVLAMAGLLVWAGRASWFGNHLIWMGVAALAGSVAWAWAAFCKEESETGLIP